ncbi:MAG: cysteine--tRNA ligase [Planctomycetes bacterium]|nr:cysteine--tRNA ligase [Planctomycetota bacterium]
MSIQIQDSLRRRKAPFRPLVPGQVSLYVCGPTVYDDCHIGHLMGPVIFDAIARWFRSRGYLVRFVNNITDIDDKIIQRALKSGEPWLAITQRYTAQYFEFLKKLHVVTITDHPRCTEYIDEMIAFVEELIAADRAYKTSDGVYYDIQRQEHYGKLSGRKLDEMLSGVRVERSEELRHPADFALWKLAKPGEPTWESPWGAGRPGWHLECSVMSSSLLGQAFDIHGGGDDLKFPHHENEIAQSEALGHSYAQCWMHNGLIQYGGVKIAKSDPRMKDPEFARQFQAAWLLDTYGAPTIRFFLLQGHYRSPVDFKPENLQAARAGLARLLKQLGALAEEADETNAEEVFARTLPLPLAERRAAYCEALDDDFSTGRALGHVFALLNDAKKLAGKEQHEALRLVRDLGRLLGLFLPGDAAQIADDEAHHGELFEQVMSFVLTLRQEARARKDFALSDRIRDGLAALDIHVEDKAGSSTWRVGS